jgi:hypothetical protein
MQRLAGNVIGVNLSHHLKNGIAYSMDEKELPLELPIVEFISRTDGEGPLANLKYGHQKHLRPIPCRVTAAAGIICVGSA